MLRERSARATRAPAGVCLVTEAIARFVVELTIAFVLKRILPIAIQIEPRCLV